MFKIQHVEETYCNSQEKVAVCSLELQYLMFVICGKKKKKKLKLSFSSETQYSHSHYL